MSEAFSWSTGLETPWVTLDMGTCWYVDFIDLCIRALFMCPRVTECLVSEHPQIQFGRRPPNPDVGRSSSAVLKAAFLNHWTFSTEILYSSCIFWGIISIQQNSLFLVYSWMRFYTCAGVYATSTARIQNTPSSPAITLVLPLCFQMLPPSFAVWAK